MLCCVRSPESRRSSFAAPDPQAPGIRSGFFPPVLAVKPTVRKTRWRPGALRTENDFWKENRDMDISPTAVQGFKASEEPSLSNSSDLEQQLEALRKAYAEALPGKVLQLAHVMQQARVRQEIPALRREAQHLSHMLRGTAGSYGFHGVSASAGRLEDTLRGMEEDPRLEASWAKAEEALNQMRCLVPGTLPPAPSKTPPAPAPRASPPPSQASSAAEELAVEKALSSLCEEEVTETTWLLVEAALEDATHDGPIPDATQPVTEEEAVLETLVRSIHAVPQVVAPSGQPRVLLVEDDASVQEFAAVASLRQLVQTVPARSLEEALTVAKHERLDAALIDMNLPDGSGPELAQALRALPGLSNLPIGFMSGDGRAENRVSALYASGSLFLPKPLDLDTLGTAVRQLAHQATPDSYRVLLVDDDPEYTQRIALLLMGYGMKVATLNTPVGLIEMLGFFKPDVLLLDEMMPGMNGFDLCRMLRRSPDWRLLAVILLTARSSAEDRLQAYRCGADDHVTKPVADGELIARVQLRAERARAMEEVIDHDALSGLLTRDAFCRRLGPKLVRATECATTLSVCLMELDHFRMINNVGGHMAADQVLAALGQLLSSRFRSVDLRARWSVGEFILAFEGVGSEVAAEVVRRVFTEFSGLTFLDEEGSPFTASFSASVALFPLEGETLKDLFKVLDRRLYQSRNSGHADPVCCQD